MTVTVTPYRIWPQAKFAKVTGGGKPRDHVPVVQIFWTPADLTVYKSQYPNGVIFINEEPIPSNANPIQLPEQATSQTQIQVTVTDNAGWPSGSVVTFT
jgi:hypothetical protein